MTMNSVSRNMGFLWDSRWIDLGITLACAGITAYAVRGDIDELVPFVIPAGIRLFRQFAPLLSFPFVVSIGIALLLGLDWAGLLPFEIGIA